MVVCSNSKIVCSLRTTYSRLDKLSPDDATLPPVSCRAPRPTIGKFSRFSFIHLIQVIWFPLFVLFSYNFSTDDFQLTVPVRRSLLPNAAHRCRKIWPETSPRPASRKPSTRFWPSVAKTSRGWIRWVLAVRYCGTKVLTEPNLFGHFLDLDMMLGIKFLQKGAESFTYPL